jgi:Xaa-Pro aminopeptidase
MINHDKFTAAEIENRIRNLQLRLQENEIDGALIVQNTDLYYFTGTGQQGFLYVSSDEKSEPVLMIRKDFQRAKNESFITNVVPLASPKQIPEILKSYDIQPPQTLGLELDVIPAAFYLNFCKLFPNSKIVDVSHDIRMVRSVKSEYELKMLEKAAKLADRVTRRVGQYLKEGISEIELAGKIEAFARKLGHQGIVRMRLWGNELFYGHLMAGPSAAVSSYLSSPTGGEGINPFIAQGSGARPIKQNEPVLFDYTFACNGYIADQTRIFAINRLDNFFLEAHEAMLEVQQKIARHARPQTPAGDLYDLALDTARFLGYESCFMGFGQKKIPFVGHGVGLELDEYPFLAKGQKMRLQKNMTIAVEPKLIFPDKGVVGIENTFVVEDNGLRPLTRSDEAVQIV